MSSSSVVGIDLGYQNSLIAVAGRGGVDVILNGNSNRLNPYVRWEDCFSSSVASRCVALRLFCS